MYEYRAFITKVYDGDTVTADIDLGFGLVQRGVKLRLCGINTPEIRGGTEATKAAARSARGFLAERVLMKDVTIRTFRDKTGKYGRYLARIILDDGTDINQLMVNSGHAVSYMAVKL
jgi:micrococcal nuclease